ncbi:arginase family protein [Leifsonia sp. NPDC058230]|uniref:arginase family protein n=1 Tax=Leifsonia sp. NPDC058230 TaxID=3346391 RepID=UPI0036DEC0F7
MGMAGRRRIVVVGAPSSAGSYAAGQEQAPRVLRERGIVERLRERGHDVTDGGDGPLQVWAPDAAHPLAQNVGQVIASVTDVDARVGEALDDGAHVLVLGGSCLVALGVMSALTARAPDAGLVYMDRHSDLNTPETTTDGALDWMGLAHLLDVPGIVRELRDALRTTPVLTPDRVHLFGVDPAATTGGERRIRDTLGLSVTTGTQVAADPRAAAESALAAYGPGPLAVHLDVDVLDFTDAPLAEDTGGRNSGPALAEAAEALAVLCRDPRFRVLSVGELNPTRSVGESRAIDRFVDALARAL